MDSCSLKQKRHFLRRLEYLTEVFRGKLMSKDFRKDVFEPGKQKFRDGHDRVFQAGGIPPGLRSVHARLRSIDWPSSGKAP